MNLILDNFPYTMETEMNYVMEQNQDQDQNQNQDKYQEQNSMGYYNIDEWIAYYLCEETDYYINGGKAFNFYYPEETITTEDTDMVATDSVCKRLFYKLKTILGQNIKLDNREPCVVQSCRVQDTTYTDETPQGPIFRRVRSFLVNKITILDVMIVDSIDSYDVFRDSTGIQFIAHDLFYNDFYLEYLKYSSYWYSYSFHKLMFIK